MSDRAECTGHMFLIEQKGQSQPDKRRKMRCVVGLDLPRDDQDSVSKYEGVEGHFPWRKYRIELLL